MSDYSEIQMNLARRTMRLARRNWLVRRTSEINSAIAEAEEARSLLMTDLEGNEGLDEGFADLEFLSLLRRILGDSAEQWGNREFEIQVGSWLAVQECDARIRQSTRAYARHTASLEEYTDVEAHLDAAVAAKIASIEIDDGPVKEAVALDDERTKELEFLVLLFEGIKAGKAASATLIQLEKLLRESSAEVAVAVVLDSSAMALLGNDKLNHARLLARTAQVHIDNLESELIDLRQTKDNPPPYGGWAQFIDEWLDCFVFDIVEKKRLNESLRSTKDIARQIYGAVADLESRWQTTILRLEALAVKRSQLGW